VGFRAVVFDAGNTLLFLDYPRMAHAVGAALGVALTGDALARGAPAAALRMEEGRATDRDRTVAFLDALFGQAGVPAERLAEVRATLERLHAERHLWSGIAPDTHDALARLRAGGFRLGVVSNSDGRVEEALRAAGLLAYFDVIVDSTLAGVEKPDPAIFRPALEALEVRPEDAVYVGDLYDVDVAGARAAGMTAILFAPGEPPGRPGCATTTSLGALADDLLKERLAS
jgi:putative hydrolase of the HAD superfamily